MTVENLFRDDLLRRRGYAAASAGNPDAVRLHCNENPWQPPGVGGAALNRYPDQQPRELIARLAGLYETRPANVLVTRGADDAIDLVIRGFCAPRRDAVVQCPPTFVMYAFFTELHGCRVVDVPLTNTETTESSFAPRVSRSPADQGATSTEVVTPAIAVAANFAVDWEGIRRKSVEGARLVFLCSPNNPTGTLIDREEVLRLASDVRERSVVVVDEAYIEFADQPGLADCIDTHPNLVVLRTLSKAWSLAGARLGVVVANAEIVDYMRRAVVPPFPLSRLSVSAALEALDPKSREQFRRRIRDIIECREWLRPRLEAMSFITRVYAGAGNFLLVHAREAAQLVDHCRERGFLLRDQSSQAGLSSHVRISIGTRAEMEGLLQIMREFEALS